MYTKIFCFILLIANQHVLKLAFTEMQYNDNCVLLLILKISHIFFDSKFKKIVISISLILCYSCGTLRTYACNIRLR